jgi:hypothetical protein
MLACRSDYATVSRVRGPFPIEAPTADPPSQRLCRGDGNICCSVALATRANAPLAAKVCRWTGSWLRLPDDARQTPPLESAEPGPDPAVSLEAMRQDQMTEGRVDHQLSECLKALASRMHRCLTSPRSYNASVT